MLILCSLCVHNSFISYGKNVNTLFTKNLQKFFYLFIVCSQFAELFNRAPDAQNLKTTDSTQEYFPTLKIKTLTRGVYYGKNFNDFVKSYCSRQFSLQKLFSNSKTIKHILTPNDKTKHIFPSPLLIIFAPTPLTISKIYDTIKIAKGKELS